MRRIATWSAIPAALMSLTLVAGCSPQPDPKDRVSQQLKNEHIDDVNVDFDRDAKVVHLKGAVDTTAERTRAEEIAQRAVGTSGTVANELTVKGVDEETADDMDGSIRKELKDAVDSDASLKDRDINFDVNNGVVTIKGDVRSAAEKERAGQIARSARNVKDVVNSLDVKADQGKNGPAKYNRKK